MNLLITKLRLFFSRSDYIKNVFTLMTGTALSQLVPIASAPILTRIYDAESFGTFALYMAIVMVAVVAATGRYEQAIILPKQDNESLNIVALCIFLSFFFCLLLVIAILASSDIIAKLSVSSNVQNFLYYLPFSIFLTSIYQSLYYWFNRKKEYKILTNTKIINSFVFVAAQLLLHNFSKDGLILGYIVGQFTSVTLLIWQTWQYISRLDEHISITRKNISNQAGRYIKFPKFLLIGHVMNTIAGNIPIFLLSSFFGTSASGLYSLTHRVLFVPTSLIGVAISDVFREKAAKDYLDRGHCNELFFKTFKTLFVISILPTLIFLFLSPTFFPILFGQKWAIAGIYAQILTPMFFCHFITIPLCSMFMIAEKQELDLAWQVVGMIFAVSSIWIGYHYFHSDIVAVSLFSLSFSILYSASGVMGYQFSLGNKK
jgi:O-antigen/teichoic acid export membrane protein